MISGFSGNGWADIQERIAHQFNISIPTENKSVNLRKIRNDAQWVFLDWAQENTPAVPHHLLRKTQRRMEK